MVKQKWFLVTGDILTIAIVTIVGFVTHGEVDMSFLPRMLAAFIPVTLAWFLLAPWFGLFQQEIVSNTKLLWRPVYAMLLAGPFAVVMRGLILNAPIIPVFAVVLSSTSAFGILVWRWIYFLLNRK